MGQGGGIITQGAVWGKAAPQAGLHGAAALHPPLVQQGLQGGQACLVQCCDCSKTASRAEVTTSPSMTQPSPGPSPAAGQVSHWQGWHLHSLVQVQGAQEQDSARGQ